MRTVRDECDPEATNFVWWDCDLAWSVRDSIHVGFHPAPTGIAGLTIYLAQARGQVVGWGGQSTDDLRSSCDHDGFVHERHL